MCGWQTAPPLLFLGYTQPTHLHSDSGSNTWSGSPLSMPICHACTAEAFTQTRLHARHCLFCFHSHCRCGTLLFDKKLSWIHDLNESPLVNSNSYVASGLTYCEGTFFFSCFFSFWAILKRTPVQFVAWKQRKLSRWIYDRVKLSLKQFW